MDHMARPLFTPEELAEMAAADKGIKSTGCKRSPDWWPRYYEANKDRIRANATRWQSENRERAREIQRSYYERNRDAILAREAKYREENREEYNARHREYYRKKKEAKAKEGGNT